jgi:hypothetical protein
VPDCQCTHRTVPPLAVIPATRSATTFWRSTGPRRGGPGLPPREPPRSKVDVLSKPDLLRALQGRRADAVICGLTSLTKTAMSHKDMTATNVLRSTAPRT